MCEWVSRLSIILAHLLQTVKVEIVPSLPSRGNPLVINNKVDREKGTFEPNIDIRGSIDWQEFKGVYNSEIKIDM